tara:strand:- start:2 stop:427 length:426 start_codon:yes stop_codon:yes gene_type:complete
MKKIYSKVEDGLLLHMICPSSDIAERDEQRVDLIDAENFIQCSSLKMKQGTTFKPHKHIYKERCRSVIAQESWVVIKGSVKCILYDIDDTVVAEEILEVGDASFTLRGGHNYEALEDDTFVYEYKTGPYEGQKLDKEFIHE